MIIFGHRGTPGYPPCGENTRMSFEKALNDGANGLEFDVRRCRDGKIVVIHDDTIDRTTNGSGRVADLSYEELKKFDAGSNEPVPLLSDILREFGTKCLLNIEVKERDLAADIKTLVLEARLADQVLVSAFDWLELKSFVPEIPIALLASQQDDDMLATAKALRANAIHPCKDILTSALLAEAHEAGLKVHVWTINDSREVSRFRSLGVDGIFTDFPERCSTPAS